MKKITTNFILRIEDEKGTCLAVRDDGEMFNSLKGKPLKKITKKNDQNKAWANALVVITRACHKVCTKPSQGSVKWKKTNNVFGSIKSIFGLFFPVYWDDGKLGFTFSVGHVPIGWIMVAIAVIVKYL